MKNILTICLSFGVILVNSCIKSDYEPAAIPGNDVVLKLEVNGIETGVQEETRATVPPVGDETKVSSLYLLFFDYSINGSGAYVNSKQYTTDPQMNIIIPMSELGLNHEKNYSILALANIEKFIGSDMPTYLSLISSMTESQVKEYTVLRITGVDLDEYNDNMAIDQGVLPMSGTCTRMKDENEVTMSLDRIVSRFDVQNTQSLYYDMVSVSIWNASRKTSAWAPNTVSSPEYTKRFYGIRRTGAFDDILGGLYAFENFQSSPGQDDQVTTCLVVGMSPKPGAPHGTAGQTMYYRININPDGYSQNLKRNYVYKVSIRSVNRAGDADEAEAWGQPQNSLDVTINNWNLDEEGMILTDGVNTMVVPVKRVRLDPLGDTREYSIFTMGPGTLSISKSQLPAGFSVRLDGNLLTVTATELPANQEEKRGSIELSLGSLRGTIDFIQSRAEHEFLTLNKYIVPAFPALDKNRIPNGPIEVTSSGPWQAKIYNLMVNSENPGFSFELSGVETDLTQATNGSDYVNIYTTGSNPNNETRHSFVLFSLIGNEDINSAVVLSQKPSTKLMLDPQYTSVYFNGLGTPRDIPGAVPGNAITFTVDPGSEDGVMNEWDAELLDTDGQYFNLGKTSMGFSQKVEVSAKGTQPGIDYQNVSGVPLDARLRVWLKADPSMQVFVAVNQDALGLTCNNIGIPKVPVTGVIRNTSGVIEDGYMEFEVDIDPSMTWRAEIVSNDFAEQPAFLINTSGQKVTTLESMSSTQTLRVGFEKVHYPLVEKTPSAKIRVQVVGTNMDAEVFSIQEALVARPFNILDVLNYSWGSLTSREYFTIYPRFLENASLFGTAGVVRTRTSRNMTGYNDAQYPYKTDPIPYTGTAGHNDGVIRPIAYVHMGSQDIYYNSYHYTSSENWRNSTDGVLVWPHDNINPAPTFNNPQSSIYKAGYRYMAPNGESVGDNRPNRINPAAKNTRIVQYLLKDGPFTKGTEITTTLTFHNDGVRSGVDPTSLSGGAVAVLTHQGTSGSGGNGAAMLIIDPLNRMVFIGDGQMFHTDNNGPNGYPQDVFTITINNPSVTTDKDKFLCNLLAYIVNAAQYGSHFTDIFIDDTLPYPIAEP